MPVEYTDACMHIASTTVGDKKTTTLFSSLLGQIENFRAMHTSSSDSLLFTWSLRPGSASPRYELSCSEISSSGAGEIRINFTTSSAPPRSVQFFGFSNNTTYNCMLDCNICNTSVAQITTLAPSKCTLTNPRSYVASYLHQRVVGLKKSLFDLSRPSLI